MIISRLCKHPMMKSIIKKPRGLVQFFLLICMAGLLALAIFCGILMWNLPSVSSLKKYKPAVSTEVYSKEFIKVGEFFEERRMFVPFEKIPPMLIHAFISAEDASFYEHGGISLWAIMRAAIKNVEAGYKNRGGAQSPSKLHVACFFLRKRITPEKFEKSCFPF